MNKSAWLYVIGAIACTAGLWAQTSTPQRPASSSGDTRREVVIGCISRETQGLTAANPGAATGTRFIITDTRGFIITDTRGGRASAYRLDGDQSQLDIHVGHTLEIAGPIWPWSERQRLKVESLTYISNTCQK
jgi:hypothetical protein